MRDRTKRHMFEALRAFWSFGLIITACIILIITAIEIVTNDSLTQTTSTLTPWFTLILAMVATLTFVTSFRNRPIKLEIMREHTKKLREVADKWSKQIPRTPEIAIPLTDDQLSTETLKLPIEGTPLFNDLYRYHLPQELIIQRHWEDFKDSFDRIMHLRNELTNTILLDMQVNTGLTFVERDMEKGNFNRYLFGIIVEWMTLKNVQQHPNNPGILKVNGNNLMIEKQIVANDYSNDSAEVHKDNIVRLVNDKKYDEILKKLHLESENLDKGRDYLQRMLTEELLQYPILFGECRYTYIPLFQPMW